MKMNNAEVVNLTSDMSMSEEEDDEGFHIMDPSDPRAHQRQRLTVQPTRRTAKNDTTPPTELLTEEEEDEDLGQRLRDDKSNNKENQDASTKPKRKISNWTLSRFLNPNRERKPVVMEDPPMEPLNDHILSDFSTRFRGNTGSFETEDEDKEDKAEENPFKVGAALFSTASLKKQSDKQDDQDKPRDEKKKDSQPKRKRPENRYFGTDITSKCYNCGEVGHISHMCPNPKKEKPCHYCAYRGHLAYDCPRLPCLSCLQVGHESSECPNKPMKTTNCEICGRASHDSDDCTSKDEELKNVTCMVCLKKGHMQCTPVPAPEDRKVYCPFCAASHPLRDCRMYNVPDTFSLREMHTSAMSRRPRRECFQCGSTDHLVADCPQSYKKRRRDECQECGSNDHETWECEMMVRRPPPKKRRTGKNRGGRRLGRD